jgi:uncharacterized membrane protein YhaH (DUF805 family)
MHDYFTLQVASSLYGLWLVAYFVPTIVVLARRHRAPGPTIVVNTLLGWTGIGWVVALAMSLGRTGQRVTA